eukprot:TRINITY_DN29260_c0_g3_i1.p1 TRINITY_DN29260_c0_g3~~TRINITY_DN29260_c0_g3_i1.p1  ORF type:complete len:605 (+),score=121.43 TRINITY_DN29260_c0_g3_i1:68-1882(+)
MFVMALFWFTFTLVVVVQAPAPEFSMPVFVRELRTLSAVPGAAAADGSREAAQVVFAEALRARAEPAKHRLTCAAKGSRTRIERVAPDPVLMDSLKAALFEEVRLTTLLLWPHIETVIRRVAFGAFCAILAGVALACCCCPRWRQQAPRHPFCLACAMVFVALLPFLLFGAIFVLDASLEVRPWVDDGLLIGEVKAQPVNLKKAKDKSVGKLETRLSVPIVFGPSFKEAADVETLLKVSFYPDECSSSMSPGNWRPELLADAALRPLYWENAFQGACLDAMALSEVGLSKVLKWYKRCYNAEREERASATPRFNRFDIDIFMRYEENSFELRCNVPLGLWTLWHKRCEMLDAESPLRMITGCPKLPPGQIPTGAPKQLLWALAEGMDEQHKVGPMCNPQYMVVEGPLRNTFTARAAALLICFYLVLVVLGASCSRLLPGCWSGPRVRFADRRTVPVFADVVMAAVEVERNAAHRRRSEERAAAEKQALGRQLKQQMQQAPSQGPTVQLEMTQPSVSWRSGVSACPTAAQASSSSCSLSTTPRGMAPASTPPAGWRSPNRGFAPGAFPPQPPPMAELPQSPTAPMSRWGSNLAADPRQPPGHWGW